MEKIKKLKKIFHDYKIDGYLVPKNDEFFSEYTSENEDKLKFLTSFTGSYGFALILKKINYLFVDGRYTLQANIQSGKKFKIITIPNKLPSDLLRDEKITIGFDPKLYTYQVLHHYFKKTNCKLIPINQNLIENIWSKKKRKLNGKFFNLKDVDVGQSSITKINILSKLLNKKKVDMHFVSAPENIAWLLNLRGCDSEFSPIPNGYLLLDNKKIFFFCDLNKINKKLKQSHKKVNFLNIKNIELFLLKIKNKKILIDKKSCSVLYNDILKENNKIIDAEDPIYYLKSIKNKIEIKNTIKSHVYDGAALTKFLFWIKNNYKKIKITEINAQEKLLKFRKNNKTFKFLSFPTISGTGPNGAIIHYKANKKTNRTLMKGDVYLVDSGGQYNFGTTDVTRTISLDNNNKKIKDIYTRILKGHIAVASYNLKKTTRGSEIDTVARKYLKQINLDYAHGTGHGVGYFLNVHEGPHGISKNNRTQFEEGVIVSNEPGYYEKNNFGIRIENLIFVKKVNKNFKFENLTMVPIDKSLIEEKLLNKSEIKWLNAYHSEVFKNLKKFMNKPQLADLERACSNI